MVAATEQPVVENQVFKNAEHSPNLDRITHKTTYAMMVVPFYILEHLHGVVSCVQLTSITSEDGRPVLVGNEPLGLSDLIWTVLERGWGDKSANRFSSVQTGTWLGLTGDGR